MIVLVEVSNSKIMWWWCIYRVSQNNHKCEISSGIFLQTDRQSAVYKFPGDLTFCSIMRARLYDHFQNRTSLNASVKGLDQDLDLDLNQDQDQDQMPQKCPVGWQCVCVWGGDQIYCNALAQSFDFGFVFCVGARTKPFNNIQIKARGV